MTYADEAVLFPIADLYDQGAMQAYISAVKDLYDRGEKAYQQFISDYGNFTSASPGDVEYWNNNTMKPVIDKYNQYVAAGIDPLRSREAMADLMATSRNLPYANLAALRQNAKTYEKFNDARRELQKKNLYNPILSSFEGPNPENFTTIDENGNINMFNRESPTPILDAKSFSDPFYANITPMKVKTSINGVDKVVTQISPEMLRNIASDNIENIINTPQGNLMYKYYLEQSKDENGNTDQLWAAQQLIDHIAQSQRSKLMYLTEDDDNYIAMQQLDIAKRRQDLEERKLEWNEEKYNSDLALKYAQAGYTYDESTGTYVPTSGVGSPIEFSDYRQMNSQLNRRDQVLSNIGEFVQDMITNQLKDIDAYNQALEELKTGVRKSQSSVTRHGFATTRGAVMAQPSKTTTYTTTESENVPKRSKEEMARLRKRAQAAKFEKEMYQRYLNPDGTPNIQKLIENGYIDQNGNPTAHFMKLISRVYAHDRFDNEEDRIANAERLYNLYRASSPEVGTPEHTTLLNMVSGSVKEVNVPGLPNAVRATKLNRFKLAPVRMGNITGANLYDKDSLPAKFLTWMLNNKIDAYIDDQADIADAYVPNAQGTRMDNDVMLTVNISAQDMERAWLALGITNKELKNRAMKLMGIQVVAKETSTAADDTKNTYLERTFYSIPVIRTVSNGITRGEINQAYNKTKYGAATAKERERSATAAGLQSTMVQ